MLFFKSWDLIIVIDFTAHEDSIWSVAWAKSEKDGVENVVTGSIDDNVKVWKWSVNPHPLSC